ncbi:MAG TPA: glucosidase, partial [Gammaproteobacteria bacterium]|nr:glucosidase [Gammaproteobacteria bacterium]
GYSLKQADSTGWMAMFALNMTVIALELTAEMHDYEDVAIQCYKQFMAIANSIAGYNQTGLTLWDEKDEFFKDLVVGPEGQGRHIDVFSWVGLIPLFAAEVIDQRLLKKAPRFERVLRGHYKGTYEGHKVAHCPIQTNARGEHLLSLLGPPCGNPKCT